MTPAATAQATSSSFRDRIVKPILIVSTPRSGSTLLFETLAKAPGLYSPGGESHRRIEQIADFGPARRGWTLNRLDRTDALPESVEALAEAFYSQLQDRDGRAADGPVRLLEKTPKNALRVPFFDAAWPDSRFVFLYRDVRQTLASMMEAWASGRFITYPALPGWGQPFWSLLLVPGWRDLVGRPIPEVVAHQWARTMNLLLDDLGQLDADRVVRLDYADLLANPQQTMLRIAPRLEVDWDVQLPASLPLSRTTFSPPDPEKWRRLERFIEQVWPIVAETDERARAFVGATAL